MNRNISYGGSPQIEYTFHIAEYHFEFHISRIPLGNWIHFPGSNIWLRDPTIGNRILELPTVDLLQNLDMISSYISAIRIFIPIPGKWITKTGKRIPDLDSQFQDNHIIFVSWGLTSSHEIHKPACEDRTHTSTLESVFSLYFPAPTTGNGY